MRRRQWPDRRKHTLENQHRQCETENNYALRLDEGAVFLHRQSLSPREVAYDGKSRAATWNSLFASKQRLQRLKQIAIASVGCIILAAIAQIGLNRLALCAKCFRSLLQIPRI